MPDYAQLREMVSHRLTFELDHGARVVGYLGGTRPAQGSVQLALLSAVLLFDAEGALVGTRPELAVVPNQLVGVTRDAATPRLTLAYDTGASIVGVPVEDALGAAGLQSLRDAVIRGSDGQVLARCDQLVVATRPFVHTCISEGPGGF